MRKMKLSSVLLTALAFVIALYFFIPLFWMLTVSVKSDAEAVSLPIHFLPYEWEWGNFKYAWENGLWGYVKNSLIAGLGGTVLQVVVYSLAAFGLTRLDIPLKRFLFPLFLSTMMIPGIVTLVPTYLQLQKFNWINTYMALTIPYAAGFFGVFLMSQFFRGFPKEIEEAAYIDGANKFQVYSQVVMPSAFPIIATFSIMAFMGIYNDYVYPFYVTTTNEMRTVTTGIAILAKGQYSQSFGRLMACTTVSIVPMLVVFLLGQKYFVKAYTTSGIK